MIDLEGLNKLGYDSISLEVSGTRCICQVKNGPFYN